MIRRALAFLLALVFASAAGAQTYRPGFAPGFRSGFQFTVGNVLWTPLNLGSALVAWWDPTQGISLNGSTVSSWTDRVGSIVASQATTASQPPYSATGLNGYPALLPTAANNFLTIATAQLTQLPQGTTPSYMATVAGSTINSQYYYLFGYGAQANTKDRAIGQTVSEAAYVDTGNSSVTSTSTWYGNTLILEWSLLSTGSSTLYTNATSTGTGTQTNLGTGAVSGAIGKWPSFGNTWIGPIGDIIVCNAIPSASAQAKMQGYLAWKYGLQGNLPSGHPYKSRAPYVSDP